MQIICSHRRISVAFPKKPAIIRPARGCSSSVEHQLPKLNRGVRFPSPAPKKMHPSGVHFLWSGSVRGIERSNARRRWRLARRHIGRRNHNFCRRQKCRRFPSPRSRGSTGFPFTIPPTTERPVGRLFLCGSERRIERSEARRRWRLARRHIGRRNHNFCRRQKCRRFTCAAGAIVPCYSPRLARAASRRAS